MVDLKETLRETSVPVGHWRASIRDFMIALIVFGTLFGAVAVDRGHAFPMPPPPELAAGVGNAAAGQSAPAPIAFKVEAPAMSARTDGDRSTLMLMMTLALAAMAAFNTTVWRHLRGSYGKTGRTQAERAK